MILTYRPELENPPMAKECSIGFSFLPTKEGRKTVDYVRIESGVTRDFPEETWEKIQNYSVVKNLLSLGALSVTQEIEVQATVVSETAKESIKDVDLKSALVLIESTFDIEQLNKWNAKDQRIRVKNAINARIAKITEGNG